MTVPIYGGNTPSIDAFGRLRTSGTGQRLDVEFIYDKQNDLFDEVTNNGTVTHNTNTRDLTLSISDANDGTYAKMASYPVPYTPGNSQLIDMTGVLDLAGIGGGSAEVFLRTKISGSVVEETIDESDWASTTGTIDWTKSHIFSIDFQSLKVGRIRFSLIRNGLTYQVAEITKDNSIDSGYWQLPNLPVYYKLYNDATNTYMELGYGDDANGVGFRYKIAANASATMKAICCTAKSEGGENLRNLPGLARSVDTVVTTQTVSTTLVPIISIRPKATFQSLPNLGLAIPKSFSLQTTEAIRVVLMHDVTLTDPVWADVDTDQSMMEYDVSATALSNGHINFSDYVYATSSGPAASQQTTAEKGLLGKTVLWDRQHDTVTGIYTLAAVRTGGVDASVLAGLLWEEIR